MYVYMYELKMGLMTLKEVVLDVYDFFGWKTNEKLYLYNYFEI